EHSRLHVHGRRPAGRRQVVHPRKAPVRRAPADLGNVAPVRAMQGRRARAHRTLHTEGRMRIVGFVGTVAVVLLTARQLAYMLAPQPAITSLPGAVGGPGLVVTTLVVIPLALGL